MKLLVFLILTVAGMGAGLVIGFGTRNVGLDQHSHVVFNTVAGTLGGAALAAIAVFFSTPAPPRRRSD